MRVTSVISYPCQFPTLPGERASDSIALAGPSRKNRLVAPYAHGCEMKNDLPLLGVLRYWQK
jgi:hypothetical protein